MFGECSASLEAVELVYLNLVCMICVGSNYLLAEQRKLEPQSSFCQCLNCLEDSMIVIPWRQQIQSESIHKLHAQLRVGQLVNVKWFYEFLDQRRHNFSPVQFAVALAGIAGVNDLSG